MLYDKPFKEYDEQIEHLKNIHLLHIDNISFAKQALRTFSYYDLINGYKDLFMVDDVFKDGVSFEYLYVFNNFNINIQNILFKYSVIAENIFKNNLAYVLSKNFGIDCLNYLNHKNYANPKGSDNRKILTDTLGKMRKTAENTNEHPTKYYRDNHNHIPPWILFKNVNFGQAIDLAKFLKTSEKSELYDLIFPYFRINGINTLPLIPALTIIRKFRNVIAHNLKFISFKPKTSLELSRLPDLFHNHLLNGYRDGKSINNTYSFMLSLLLILGEPILINDFIQDIGKLLAENHNLGSVFIDFFTITDIPADIIERLRDFSEEYQHKAVSLESV